MLKMLIKYQGGNYELKTDQGIFTGRSYLDCLVKLVKAPIPIKYAKWTNKQKFDWVENEYNKKYPDCLNYNYVHKEIRVNNNG